MTADQLPIYDLERAVQREMRKRGCDRYDACLAVLKILEDRRSRMRRNETYQFRAAIGDMLINTLFNATLPEPSAECIAAGLIDAPLPPLPLGGRQA